MCGIAGFVTPRPPAEARRVLAQMGGLIAHRGPDAANFYAKGPAHLAHRRLAIIDLADGHQPMANETGELTIVYNGEVFNHASLRPALEAAGHRYTSHCDTETILHAFEEYGPRCLDRFRGMFAFAIWDERKQTLFAARDRLGIKPFYYYFDGQQFVFASEIKSILSYPGIAASFQDDLLPEYLALGFTSGDQTLFRGIRKLMPGHFLRLDLSGGVPRMAIERYWDLPRQAATEKLTDAEWIAETRRRLEETVQMRLMSDVPLGMFLSGGIDSSAIAALMSRMVSGKVKSFSVGYAEEQYSELSYARQVAGQLGTDHHEIRVSMEDFFGALPQLIWHEDEPIAWPSSVSLYYVSRLASQQVKVVLTGEGSDENFAGYERYGHYLFNSRGMAAWRHLPAALRTGLRETIRNSSWLSGDLRRKIQHTFIGREDSFESLQLDNFYGAFSLLEQTLLLKPGVLAQSARPYANYLQHWQVEPQTGTLGRMLYADSKTYLVELLMKQDQMSMACSIESRVPFLDHTFVEFATRVPDHLRIARGERKYILKKAVEDLLPASIIYRKKMGFPTPLRQWLRQEQSRPVLDTLGAADGLLASYIDPAYLNQLLTAHRQGLEDGTDRIWRLLNLQLWGDTYLGGRPNRWDDAFPATGSPLATTR